MKRLQSRRPSQLAYRRLIDRRRMIGRRTCRAGFTVVEVLVVLTLLGILVALILPALQYSRATARRVECTNRLRQIGVALASFEAQRREIPPARSSPSGLAWTTFLLPWLDQTSVFQQIDFTATERQDDEYNSLSLHRIPQFLCPDSALERGTNFLGNVGTSYLDVPPQHVRGKRIENGFFALGVVSGESSHRRLRLSDMTDGLSTTVAVSESRQAGPPTPQNARVGSSRGLAFRLLSPGETAADYAAFVDACDSLTGPQRVSRTIGAAWHDGEIFDSLYTHHLPPNRNNCMFALAGTGMIAARSVATASSQHGSGAHVLLADSSTRFMSQDIAYDIWRSLGTRGGREVLNDEF